jgi:hypothetical protein
MPTPTIPLAIELICARMQSLTAGQPTRFEIHHGHLRLITPGMPDGTRQGRNFHVYGTMAQQTTPATAITDFSGVLLRFLQLFPDKFEPLLPHIVALGQFMFPDEAANWTKVWATPTGDHQ